ncbi:fibrinogen C domain-containing protein 1-like [Limulus polyphemus]|uniref:Fibrinogen C domain-containing protein 1-like n=1 Tax=Limulus polyphemus TaxID=6850 RepID=A0ABM1SXW1_LIMPO|nr:fibrinogen C domain-containing protein 1-like [Limulus polyphemus]
MLNDCRVDFYNFIMRFNIIVFAGIIIIGSFTTCNASTETTTSTQSERRHSYNREPSVSSVLQQILQRLSTLETDQLQGSTQRQEIRQVLNRIEQNRKEVILSLDRSESRVTQQLDTIKGELRKILTLQEILQQDVKDLQQNQLLNKLGFEEKLRKLQLPEKEEDFDLDFDPSHQVSCKNAAVLSNLQILQTTLYGLRRTTVHLQDQLDHVQKNMTYLTNLTRSVQKRTEKTVTTEYLRTALKASFEEQQVPSVVPCVQHSTSPQESEETLANNCFQLLQEGHNVSGIYRIRPLYALRPIFVFCDMQTEGGGWTVIQRRKDGSVNFLREWNEYKYGFGNIGGELWLGNENIHLLTSQTLNELRIDLNDFEDGHVYAKYAGFAIGNEKENYMIKVLGAVSGDAGDSMSYHSSMPFSTKDVDNDFWPGGNCAEEHTGGWWYNQCDACNLNGQYLNGLTQQEYQGVYWYEWQGPSYSLRATSMKIRPLVRN